MKTKINSFCMAIVIMLELFSACIFAEGAACFTLDFSDNALTTGGGDIWAGSLPELVKTDGGNVLARLSNKSDTTNYYQYKLSSLKDKISGKFVIELRLKQSSTSAFYLKTFMNDGSVGAADLTARFTDEYIGAAWVDSTSTSNILGYFDSDVYPGSPNTDAGWQKLYLCIDSEKGSYEVYVDDKEHCYTKTGVFEGRSSNYLNSIRFGMSANGSGAQEYSYIDYIKIYPYSQLSLPSESERKTDIKDDFDGAEKGTPLGGLVGKVTGSVGVEKVEDPLNSANKCIKLSGNTSGGYASIPIGYKNAVIKYKFYIENALEGTAEFAAAMFDGRSKVYSETVGKSTMRLNNSEEKISLPLKDGWNTAEWVVSASDGISKCACHLNGKYVLGDTKAQTALSSLRFAAYADTVCYLDDIEIYGTDIDNGRISFKASAEENFNYSDGVSLSEHNITAVGTENTCVTKNNILKLSEEKAGEAYIVFANEFARTAEDYTAEFRIQSGKSQKQIISFVNEDEKAAELEFCGGFVKDTIGGKNIGTYFENIISDGASSEFGYHTYYVTFSPSKKIVSLRIDDAREPVYLDFNSVYADSIIFKLENFENSENTLYIDYIKIYNEKKILPGAANSALTYRQDFDGEINFALDNGCELVNSDNNKSLKVNGGFVINSGNTYRKTMTTEFSAIGGFTLRLIGLCGETIFERDIEADTDRHTYSFRADIPNNRISVYKDGNEIESLKNFQKADSAAAAAEILSDGAIIDDIVIMENGGYSEAEKQAQLEAGYELWKRLSKMKSGELVLSRGGYRFANNYSGSEGKLYLSGKKNLTIDGNGSEIIIDGFDIHALYMNNCENVSVKNLKIDYDPIPFSQGTITALDSSSKSFDVVVDNGYEMPSNEWGNMRSVYYTADGKNVKPVTANDSAYIDSVLTDNSVRLKLNSGDIFVGDGVDIGDKFVMRNFSNNYRSSVNISNSRECVFENVEIYTSPKLAITESGGYGKHLYKNVRITRRPGTDRLVSSIADGFHLSNVQNGCTVDSCEVAYTLDDCLNSYGLFANVSEKLSDKEFVIAVRNADNPFKVGQRVDFYNPSWDAVGSGEIVSVSKVTSEQSLEKMAQLPNELREVLGTSITSYSFSQIYKITLDGELPQVDCLDYAITEYAGGGNGLKIINSYFHDSHVRGLLVKASNALINNNIFENISKSAVAVVAERHFGEGGFSNNLEISDNVIKTAGYSRATRDVRNYPSIFISASDNAYLSGTSDNTNLKNITVRDNVIEDSGYIPIYAANIDGGNISGNFVIGAFGGKEQTNDGIESGFAKPWYGIKIEKSKNIEIHDNEFKNMPSFLLKEIYNPDYFEHNSSSEENSLEGIEFVNSTHSREYCDKALPRQKYLTVTPTASGASMLLHSDLSKDKAFVSAFSVITAAGTSYIMYDKNWKPVIDLCFGNNKRVYVNGKDAGSYNELQNINVSVISDGNSKFEIWFDRTLKYVGNCTSDISIVGIYFADTLRIKNHVIYTLDDFGIEERNNEIIVKNRSGQSMPDVDIFTAKYNGKSLENAEIYNGIDGIERNLGNAELTDKVFIWRNMSPLCKTYDR